MLIKCKVLDIHEQIKQKSSNSDNERGWTIRKCDIIKDGHFWLENNDLFWEYYRK